MEYFFVFVGFVVVVVLLARIGSALKNQAREITFLNEGVKLLLARTNELARGFHKEPIKPEPAPPVASTPDAPQKPVAAAAAAREDTRPPAVLPKPEPPPLVASPPVLPQRPVAAAREDTRPPFLNQTPAREDTRPPEINQPPPRKETRPPSVTIEPHPVDVFLAKAWQNAVRWIMKEGNAWVLAGVVVLLFGAVFMVHYSITKGWFTPAMRLASVGALGFAIAGVGVWLRGRRRMYALLLQGCGLSMMYLATVAAVMLVKPPLLGSTAALGILTALVVATAVLALWQDAQLVAHFAVVAGFFAPVLVSRGSEDFVGLFTFYLLLNLGILAMSFMRPWRRLYLTGFALTFGLFSLWVVKGYGAEMFWRSFPFLAAYYLLYVFMGIRALPQPGEAREQRFSTDVTLTLLAPLCFLSLASKMVEIKYLLPGIFLACGVMYAVLSVVLRGRGRNIVVLFRTEAMVCANLALPIFFYQYKPEMLSVANILALVWSLEGALLCVMGAKQRSAGFPTRDEAQERSAGFPTREIENHFRGLENPRSFMNRALGVIAFVIAGAMCVNAYVGDTTTVNYFSTSLFCALVLVASLITTAGVWAAQGAKLQINPLPGRWFMLAGLLALHAALLVEAWHVVDIEPPVWLLAALSIATLMLAVAGKIFPVLMEIGSPKKPCSLFSLGWLPVFGMAFLFIIIEFFGILVSLESSPPWIHYFPTFEFVCFAVAGAFVLSPFAPRSETRRTIVRGSRLEGFVRTVWCVMAALLAGYALGSLMPDNLSGQLLFRVPLLVLLAVVAFVNLPPRVSDFIRPKPESIFLPVTLCVLALIQLPTLLLSDGRVLGYYFPFFNPVDLLGLAAAVLPMACLYRLLRGGKDALPQIGAAAWLLVFVWLNVVVARAAHHYFDAAYTVEGIWKSNPFQTTAALVWAAVGIGTMIVSFRRGWRLPWAMGAVLVVLDVAKLFVIDLMKFGTLERVVSFMVVGLFLILVAYFAPLPPKAKGR